MSLRLIAPLFVILTFAAPVAQAADIKQLLNKNGVYTLTNLHPDPIKSKLYAANFQQDGLIRICTKVRLKKIGRKRMRFEVVRTGREYVYDHHKTAGEPFHDNLARYFGRRCNLSKVRRLSKIDQRGVRVGRALRGMSKQGVIYAIGYPPLTATPDLKFEIWRYWRNRWISRAVVFNRRGRVVRTRY